MPYQAKSPRTFNDVPSVEPKILELIREHAEEKSWPDNVDYSFEHWAERIRIAVDVAENHDTHWLVGRRRDPRSNTKELRWMLDLDNNSLALDAARAPNSLQEKFRDAVANAPRVIRNQDLTVPYPGACQFWEPGMLTPIQVRYAIGKILNPSRPRGMLRRPSMEHVDRLTDEVVSAYVALSGREPARSRPVEILEDGTELSGDPSGPLVLFVRKVEHMCESHAREWWHRDQKEFRSFRLSQERRLLRSIDRWKKNHK
jgi:hypothetical protein